jgi:phosphoribosyl-AMP cyclohydrolase / phosphoribosyl-ATP pyrophosphohydrolase
VSVIKWDERGLCVAIAQDRLTGEVRMVAWMNQEALDKTRETKRATFFSRSKKRLWTKGEESGHFLEVHDVILDCDGDSILLLVDPVGPTCHTGNESCFFEKPSLPMLSELAREIESRRGSTSEKSYTKSLLDAGAQKIGGKLREEADELARAIEGESDERVASEAADVLYHLLVGLVSRGVPIRSVLAELSRRRGISGHAEKASRAK